LLSQIGEALPERSYTYTLCAALDKTMATMTNVTSTQLPHEEQDPRRWFAVVTTPQHEKAAFRHLDFGGIETFLPTYESARVWKNRQKVKVELPLFPTYLFVRIDQGERGQVLRTPGVRKLVGNSREPLSVADREIEFLRTNLLEKNAEPHAGLIAGQRARVKSGPMQGVEGWLVRKSGGWRFILTVQLIHQQVAVEVDASTLEPIITG
jgi:transcription antitermination factor NusG